MKATGFLKNDEEERMVAWALNSPTLRLVPRQKRLLDKKNFTWLNQLGISALAVGIRVYSLREIRQLRKQLAGCACHDDPCPLAVSFLEKSKEVRDTLYKVCAEIKKLGGMYFAKRQLNEALIEWDELVEDLTATTDIELRALTKELAGLLN